MAIIIPSKKIYNVSNPKVLENAIKSLEVTENNLSYVEKFKNLRLESETIKKPFVDIEPTTFSKHSASDTPLYRFTAGLQTEATPCSISILKLNRKSTDYYITDISPQLELVYKANISKCQAISYPAEEYNGQRFDFLDDDKNDYNSETETHNNYNVKIIESDFDFDNYLQKNTNIKITDEGIFADFVASNTGEDYSNISPSGTMFYFFVEGIKKPNDSRTTFQVYSDGITWNEYVFSGYNATGYFSTAIYNGKSCVKYKGLFLNYLVSGFPQIVESTSEIISTTYTYNDNFSDPEEESILTNSGPISGITLDILPTDINTCFPHKIDVTSDEDFYYLDIKAISKLTVFVGQDQIDISKKDKSFSRPIEATKITIELSEAKVVYNETIRTLSSESKNILLENEDSQGEQVFYISLSPFIRTQNTYSSENATTALYQKTLNSYVNGKETATIACSIGEYLDEDGNSVISTKTSDKMVFELYDKVVPMIRNEYGNDVPMSQDSSGKAKVFEVVGVSESYDGALLQELTLREWIETE